MIKISGTYVKPQDIYQKWQPDSIGKRTIEQMAKSPVAYLFDSFHLLKFEMQLRSNIVAAAKALNRSAAGIAGFDRSRGNPYYWVRTAEGGFKLKSGAKPSAAINDIFRNGSKYAFECATAMMIVYYKALLDLLKENTFNRVFPVIYLFSWYHPPHLGFIAYKTADHLPADALYFNNPDFHPQAIERQGQNVFLLESGNYYGHRLGIKSGQTIIAILNKYRRPGATQPAYLTSLVTRPDFKKLERLTRLQFIEPITKTYRVAPVKRYRIKESSSFSGFRLWLKKLNDDHSCG